MLCAFSILAVGYMLGRISVKGVSLGSAGVFVAALVFGALFCSDLTGNPVNYGDSWSGWFKVAESLGLIFFVTGVGYIAGPNFFSNLKKNFRSYVFLGVTVVIVSGLAAVVCMLLGECVFGYGAQSVADRDSFGAMILGIFAGALSSTPALGAAKASVSPELEEFVSVGYGIAYLFGVIGIVLFVQIIPKLTHADMAEERRKLSVPVKEALKEKSEKCVKIDKIGLFGIALAATLGLFLGQIKIPLSSAGLDGSCFSLTTAGGCLMTALVLGHFGRIGRISITPPESTLKMLRELGLVLFLMGAGVPSGARFVANFNGMYFVYGLFITTVPILVGYLLAKHLLKMPLLENLGTLAGSMTSTPTLGTLINVSGTEDVAAAYAATYPIALIAVVLVTQLLGILL